MPKRIIVTTIHAYRDNKMVAFTPGQMVDLTVDELDEIKKVNPRAVRAPVNEDRVELTEQQIADEAVKAAKAQADAEALAHKEAVDRAAKQKEADEREADRKNADAAKAKDEADKAAVAKANVGGKGTAGKPSTVSDL